MLTYETLDHVVLNLSQLSKAELAFFRQRYSAYEALRADPSPVRFIEFTNQIHGPGNPVLAPGARITAAVMAHPLYQALRDLEDRAGIATGELAPEPGDDIDADPLADDYLPVAEVARMQGVQQKSVYKAIERGELVAAGRPSRVSRRSLDRWTVDEARKRAGQLARSGTRSADR